MATFNKTGWQRVLTVSRASAIAPPLPGLYAYAEVDDLFGLPSVVHWVYLGRTENLARRLSQHERADEPNDLLREWLRFGPDSGEIWYTIVQSSNVVEMERELIRRLRPRLNRIRYVKGDQNERSHHSS